jgi:hypothetical protein
MSDALIRYSVDITKVIETTAQEGQSKWWGAIPDSIQSAIEVNYAPKHRGATEHLESIPIRYWHETFYKK